MMRRRDLLFGGGAALSAAGLSACVMAPQAASIPSELQSAPVLPIGSPMAPIKSSMDRVTRSLVGLRPFRPTGPRLEAAKLGEKTVVHNYGHGGGGVSISWGVAEIAAEMIRAQGQGDAAVLGSGVVGLSTALELQRKGASVTIYASQFPPYTTSNVAGAMWHPTSMFDRSKVSAQTLDILHRASRIAFLRFIRYANDPRYGVYWIRQHALSDRPLGTRYPYMGGDNLYPGLVRNQGKPGPFHFPHWDGYYTLMIDPDLYLRALVSDFRNAGGVMVHQAFESEDDVLVLPEASVVNCLGLGAGAVFGDEGIMPARGQLTFLLPQSDIDYGYSVNHREHGLLYTFPRKTGILLGGSFGRGDWNREVDQAEVARMVEGHAAMAIRI